MSLRPFFPARSAKKTLANLQKAVDDRNFHLAASEALNGLKIARKTAIKNDDVLDGLAPFHGPYSKLEEYDQLKKMADFRHTIQTKGKLHGYDSVYRPEITPGTPINQRIDHAVPLTDEGDYGQEIKVNHYFLNDEYMSRARKNKDEFDEKALRASEVAEKLDAQFNQLAQKVKSEERRNALLAERKKIKFPF